MEDMYLEEVTELDYEDIAPGVYLCKMDAFPDSWTCLTFDDGWNHLGTTKNFGLDPILAYGPVE